LIYFSGNKETLDLNQFLKISLLGIFFFGIIRNTYKILNIKTYMLSSKIIRSPLQISNLIR